MTLIKGACEVKRQNSSECAQISALHIVSGESGFVNVNNVTIETGQIGDENVKDIKSKGFCFFNIPPKKRNGPPEFMQASGGKVWE